MVRNWRNRINFPIKSPSSDEMHIGVSFTRQLKSTPPPVEMVIWKCILHTAHKAPISSWSGSAANWNRRKLHRDQTSKSLPSVLSVTVKSWLNIRDAKYLTEVKFVLFLLFKKAKFEENSQLASLWQSAKVAASRCPIRESEVLGQSLPRELRISSQKNAAQ